VEAKAIVIEQLIRALEIIRKHNPARIATLGGECSVSVAPFSTLADRYGDDLAIIWIDSHPDVGTGQSEYPGDHAMAIVKGFPLIEGSATDSRLCWSLQRSTTPSSSTSGVMWMSEPTHESFGESAPRHRQRTRIRIGILGAARIAPVAMVKPAAAESEIEVTAVAARDLQRARQFSEKYEIPMAYGSYAQLLSDPGIDAVYIALPNGLHGRWTKAALQAGKHVLCEKPFTANAEEATSVAEAARHSGLVVMEAFHYRYHALMKRMLEIINSDELGSITRMEAWLCLPLVSANNIRWDYALAGGALMDAGCYPIHLLRTLMGSAEPEVSAAAVKIRRPAVDRLLQAKLHFPGGCTGLITASMLSRQVLGSGARVSGTRGTMNVLNPYHPHLGHRLAIRSNTRRAVEHVPRQPSTFASQLRAFVGAILRGEPVLTGPDDSVANMTVIDACYAAAGLPRREPTR
jgi:predicted dehydrogenase